MIKMIEIIKKKSWEKIKLKKKQKIQICLEIIILLQGKNQRLILKIFWMNLKILNKILSTEIEKVMIGSLIFLMNI